MTELPPLDPLPVLPSLDEAPQLAIELPPLLAAPAEGDFDLYLPPDMEAAQAQNADDAIADACKVLGIPFLGGASGTGASFYETAQRCPFKFWLDFDAPDAARFAGVHPEPLQIGALYHVLQAYSNAPDLGPCQEKSAGLATIEGLRRRGRPPEGLRTVPENTADLLLAELKAAAHRQREGGKGPALSFVIEAERCLMAQHVWWDHSGNDQRALAVEWLARHPSLAYTCRYDAIMVAGEHDRQIPPGGVVIREYKTASWLDEQRTEGWFLDMEILGQILLWGPSGCEARFGKLYGVVVDMITKPKGSQPKWAQILVPATIPAVAQHARWTRYQEAEIAMWRATGVYPQRFSACHNRFGRCPRWEYCIANFVGTLPPSVGDYL